jgi:hypothetical protein
MMCARLMALHVAATSRAGRLRVALRGFAGSAAARCSVIPSALITFSMVLNSGLPPDDSAR